MIKLDMIDYARLWSQSNQSSTSSLVSYDDMIVGNSWARQLSLLACCWELLLCLVVGLLHASLWEFACWVWSVVLSCVVLCCCVVWVNKKKKKQEETTRMNEAGFSRPRYKKLFDYFIIIIVKGGFVTKSCLSCLSCCLVSPQEGC